MYDCAIEETRDMSNFARKNKVILILAPALNTSLFCLLVDISISMNTTQCAGPKGHGCVIMTYLDRICALGKVLVPLARLLQLNRALLLGKTTADSARLLGTQVQGKVLLSLVK